MPGAGIVLSASSTSRCEFLTYLTGSSLPYTGHCSPLVTLEWVSIPKEIAVLRRGTSGPCSSAWWSSHWSSSLRRCTARTYAAGWNALRSHTTWLAAWHWTSRLPRHRATRTRLSCRVHRSGLIVRTRSWSWSRLGLTYRLSLGTAWSGLSRTRLSTTKIKIQAWSHKSCIKTPKTYP